jgi:hypothetical protein
MTQWSWEGRCSRRAWQALALAYLLAQVARAVFTVVL